MSLVDFIFPKKCLECGAPGKHVCQACIKKILPGGWAKMGGLRVYSIWEYRGVVRKAIIALKYKFVTEIAEELVGYINLIPSTQTLVPIPSHWYRQNLRGFNQAELLGKRIAIKMGWKFIPDFLTKKSSTLPQVGLKGTPRRQNLRGVFALNSNFQIPDSAVVIFDDVLTTGSTLKEAAKVLKKAGVKKLWCLTIAR